MRATIKMFLVKPTRSKRTIVEHKIVASKETIVGEVDKFITWRVNQHNFIPVKKFEVVIRNQSNDKVMGSWEYVPTS